MATRTIYATIRIDIKNDNSEEITDQMVEDFVENCMYCFPDTEDIRVSDTSWEHTEY